MKFEDIIARINEIVNLSEEVVKNNLDKFEKEYDNYFVRVFKHDIAIEFKDEINDLLETESVMNHFNKSKDPYSENKILYKICENYIHNNHTMSDSFKRIMEILENAEDKDFSKLTVYFGYVILKNDFIEFNNLCKMLHIGMHQKFNDSSKTMIVTEMIARKSQQLERIIPYIKISDKEVNLTKSEETESKKNYVTNSIDDIINEFKNAEGLTPDNLKPFISIFGYENYKYMIDELYDLGVITHTDYIDFVESLIDSPYEKGRK